MEEAPRISEVDAAAKIKQGKLPIVFGQELGLEGRWFDEASAATRAAGWKVVGTRGVRTDAGGSRAGAYIAVPSCIGLKKAAGQAAWDMSPAGCAGRACVAVMEAAGGVKLFLFSLYMWTGLSLSNVLNAEVLEVVARWIRQLGLPWLVGVDWQNLSRALEGSRRDAVARGEVIAPEQGACRSKGKE